VETTFDFSTPFKLGFDPAESDWSDEGVTVKEVWADKEARVLFLSFSKHFLRSQHFLRECKDFGQLVRLRKPATQKDIEDILSHVLYPMGLGEDLKPFAKALIPYVTGTAEMTWVIK
jgi:hypothetical protein